MKGGCKFGATKQVAKKRWITEVIADRVEFVEAREKTSQNANAEARGPMESMGDAAYEDIPF